MTRLFLSFLKSLSVFVLIGAFVFSFFAASVSAAASSGCYSQTGSQVIKSICPSKQISDLAATGKCFLSVNGGGFSEVACDALSPVDSITCADGTVVPASQGASACDSHGGVPGGGSNSGANVNPEPNQLVTNAAGDCGDTKGSCIVDDIQIAINVLSIGVGLVITGAIILGGIQYMLSRDNPQAVSDAKSRILNAIIALVSFVFIYAFLQWIVPGGLFH
jgi:hypothetical protein